MQTFLPYPNYADSAAVLDWKRLGKQRVETYQIMIAIFEGRGFIHHPAVRMWRGYERSLLDYQEAMVAEWTARGYGPDTCWPKTLDVFRKNSRVRISREPFWLGDYAFHISHQSRLVAKDPEYYRPRFPTVPDDIPYLWPVQVQRSSNEVGRGNRCTPKLRSRHFRAYGARV